MTDSPRLFPATAEAVARAASLICDGQLVAFPTETVYGLGADAGNESAVTAVFAAKDRPRFNPLIVHVADLELAETVAVFDESARELARAFWPGPLTLVLPRASDSGLSLLVSAGLDTVAVRVPDHPVARALLKSSNRPVAAPSANPSGKISPTTAAHVVDSLGDRVAMILDDGPCPVGVESTVIDLSSGEAALLRPGGVPIEAVETLVGPMTPAAAGPPRAPGMLDRHYAPSLPLRLDAWTANVGEALLGFGSEAHGETLNLSPAGDLREAAANLFAMLRALDTSDFEGIAVAPIPDDGLGQAINDRLRRAAASPRAESNWNEDRGPAAPCVLPGIEEDDNDE